MAENEIKEGNAIETSEHYKRAKPLQFCELRTLGEIPGGEGRNEILCGLFNVDLPFGLSSMVFSSGSVLLQAIDMQRLEDWKGVMMAGGLCDYGPDQVRV